MPDAIPETREIAVTEAGASLEFRLWRARPIIHYLQPALPGSTLADVGFLDDGRVGLVLKLPGGERQAWSVDSGDRFYVERLGDAAPHGALAIRSDGAQLAYLGSRSPADRPTGGSVDHLESVWIEPTSRPADAARMAWTVPASDEELVDLAWAPDRQHLLVVGRQHLGVGADRTSLRWLDPTSGTAEFLALLPSEVVPGSFVWSPDGHRVAFLVHSASLSAVCTLSDTGAFRYLGDLGHDGTAGPPVAPVAWAADGRLAYGALLQQAPSSGGPPAPFGRPSVGPYVVDVGGGLGHPMGGDAGLAPLWRPDGRLWVVGPARGHEQGLRLRALDAGGQTRELASLDIPTPGSTSYGVRWNLAGDRALVVTRSDVGGLAFWLVDFGWDAVQ